MSALFELTEIILLETVCMNIVSQHVCTVCYRCLLYKHDFMKDIGKHVKHGRVRNNKANLVAPGSQATGPGLLSHKEIRVLKYFHSLLIKIIQYLTLNGVWNQSSHVLYPNGLGSWYIDAVT